MFGRDSEKIKITFIIFKITQKLFLIIQNQFQYYENWVRKCKNAIKSVFQSDFKHDKCDFNNFKITHKHAIKSEHAKEIQKE